MDERFSTESEQMVVGVVEDPTLEQPEPDPPEVEEASVEFLGHWNRLISMTNWEKGRIICQWRAKLMETAAPSRTYSDEAWSRRAENVSGQHVGRLRRVWERFGDVYTQYEGLFWSHFLAAVDFDDAEMWLEGAVQNGWSVGQMRSKRWETLGGAPELKPRDEEIVSAEVDEDVPKGDPKTIGESSGEAFGPDFGDDEPPFDADTPSADMSAPSTVTAEPVRPFEDLPPLPEGLAEAVEGLKLAIIEHRLSGWQDVTCEAVVASLEALKRLATAPQDEG